MITSFEEVPRVKPQNNYAQTGMMPTRIPEMEAEGVRTLCSDRKGEVEGTEGGSAPPRLCTNFFIKASKSWKMDG